MTTNQEMAMGTVPYELIEEQLSQAVSQGALYIETEGYTHWERMAVDRDTREAVYFLNRIAMIGGRAAIARTYHAGVRVVGAYRRSPHSLRRQFTPVTPAEIIPGDRLALAVGDEADPIRSYSVVQIGGFVVERSEDAVTPQLRS